MSGVTQTQLDAILAKVEALSGGSLGERGAALVEMACARALAHCNRSDIPEKMEQAVAALAVGLDSREAGVKSVTRGDTSVTYDAAADSLCGLGAALAPWCRLGTLRED